MTVTAMITAKDAMTRIEIVMVIIREDVMTKMNVGMTMTSIKTSATGGIKTKRIVTETMTGIDTSCLSVATVTYCGVLFYLGLLAGLLKAFGTLLNSLFYASENYL